MIEVAVLAVTHFVAAAAGAFAWPHVSTLVSSWSASRAVANAKALIAKTEADAKALEAAKQVVAAAPVVVAPAPTASPVHPAGV